MITKFKLNLQLHAEGADVGDADVSNQVDAASNESTQETAPQAPLSIKDVTSSLFKSFNNVEPVIQNTEIPITEVKSEADDPIFAMPPADLDPAVTQPAQPAFDMSAMINEIKALSDKIQNPNVTPAQQQKEEQKIQLKYGLPAEDLAAITSGLQDKLYDNPEGFTDDIMKLVESQVNERMGPINGLVENLNFQKSMTDFSNAHPDLKDYEGEMVKVISEFRANPSLGINVDANKNNPALHEMVYNIAKGRTAQAPKTLDDFLSDEESLAKMASHGTVKNTILKQLADNVNSKKPPVIPGKGASSTPVSPPTNPKTIAEATRNVKNLQK